MKRLLILFATLLLLTASASASDFDAVADDLSAIGMFRGTASGFELDRAPKRSEAAIMLVRLYGAEEAAKAAYEAGEISHPFTDVSSTASPPVAWLYTNGITNGLTETTFGSGNPCSAKMYTVFLLRALGYKDGVDFQYADALTFAQEKGFYDPAMFSGDFLRDDLAALTYQALATDLADGSTYLLESLIRSGAVDKNAAAPMSETIETYRLLQTATNNSKLRSIDMDVEIRTETEVSCPDLGVFETQSIVSSGTAKTVLEDRSAQMAYELETTADGVSSRSGLWIKDRQIYQSVYTDDGEILNIRYAIDDPDAVIQNIFPADPTAMNMADLALIESITVARNGANAVYTVSFGENPGGILRSFTDETSETLSISAMEIAYTLSSRGELKKINMGYDLSMRLELPTGETGSTLPASAIYRYDTTITVKATGAAVKIHFPDFSGFAEIPADGNMAADIRPQLIYSAAPLIAQADPLSENERLDWLKNTAYDFDERGFQTVPGTYLEGSNCLAYTSELWGTPHAQQNALTIRFADGTLARLPLPGVNYNFGAAAPDSMAFQKDRFVYTVTFEEAEIVDGTVVHFKGTYYYCVNLKEKTVSLYLI